MRGVLLCMVVGIGCYAPRVPAGSACETACPGDLQCIDHVCREPGGTPDGAGPDAVDAIVIDGSPGDGDGDGIPDGVDNCPTRANADQHDEDGDDLGDVCDPCPHLAGSAVDTDGDGVGDACDPKPTIAKQRIAFFDPFTSQKPEWDHSSGFSLVGESLRATGPDAFTLLLVPTGETRIAAGGTIVSVSGTGSHQLAIALGFYFTGDRFHYAQFYDSGGTVTIDVSKANNGTFTGLAGHNTSGVLPTGTWAMTIDTSVAAQTFDLVATLGGAPYAPVTASTSTAPTLVPADRLSVFTRNGDFRFDYFVVIETVP